MLIFLRKWGKVTFDLKRVDKLKNENHLNQGLV